mgnify:CR=1 FL=1
MYGNKFIEESINKGAKYCLTDKKKQIPLITKNKHVQHQHSTTTKRISKLYKNKI